MRLFLIFAVPVTLLLVFTSDVHSSFPFTLNELDDRAFIVSSDDTVAIPRVDGTITVDGNLDERLWNEAVVWELPYEIRIGENVDAPMTTYVLMVSTRAEFYIAFVCLDPEPHRIRAALTDRNSWSRTEDDHIGVHIDTFGDKRNSYYMAVNARGVQFDAMRLDRGGQGTSDDSGYDFMWESAASITDFGYVVEISLPYRYLRMSNNTQNGKVAWNIKPFRVIPRSFRYETSPVAWDYDRNCFLCQFPAVTIDDPDRTFRPLQMIPYTSAIYDEQPTHTDFEPAIGIDLKYQTTDWAIDATILPDYSQVETDAFQMTTNIRFLPRFPEHRPFFSERTDLIRFPISQTIYTRTLIDPTIGLRWTGKTGPHNFLMLGMHDKVTWLLFPGRDTSASTVLDRQSWNAMFRYRYDMSADAVMGVFITDREFEDGYNRLISADGQFAIDDRHTFVTQLIGTATRYPDEIAESFNTPRGDFTGGGYIVRLNRSGRHWNYNIETRDFEDTFVTGMGMQQRVGIRTGAASTSYDIYPDNDLVRRVGSYINFSGTWDRSTHAPLNLTTRGGFIISGINQIYIDAHIRRERERFLGNDFNTTRFGTFFRIIPSHWYRFIIRGSAGDAIDYRLIELMTSIDGTITNSFHLFDRQLQISHDLNYYKLYHSITAQDAWIHRTYAELQITPEFAIRNIAQWRDFEWKDPRYGELTPDKQQTFENQFLIRYRFNYATAIYAGAYGRWDTQDDRSTNVWQVFAKISYLI